MDKLFLGWALLFTPAQYVPPSVLLGCMPIEAEAFQNARLLHRLRVGVRLVIEFWSEDGSLFVVRADDDGSRCLIGNTPLLPADRNDG